MKPISLELYSIRDSFGKDMKGTLELVKSYGYDGVEYAGGMDDNILKELKEALDNADLKSYSWHASLDRFEDSVFDQTIEACKQIGCEALVIPGVASEYYESEKKALELCDLLNKNYEKLKPYGIKLGYHNHMQEFNQMPCGKSIWTIFCENTNPEIIMQFDTGNALHGNANLQEEFKSMKDRMGIIHVKPYSMTTGFEAIIGEDDVAYEEIFKFCRTDGKTCRYVIEWEGLIRENEMDAAKRCIDNLKSKYRNLL